MDTSPVKAAEWVQSRRTFLGRAAAASASIALVNHIAPAFALSESQASPKAKDPWYRRITRWGQTNIAEIDPTRYDVNWWRRQWERTETQGVIINAGGIVAYYPTQVPLHRQAKNLAGRDLFGELCRAARKDGLAVLARMDSSRVQEEVYRAHPDWFAVSASGRPHRAGELYVTCVNGPYYKEQIPAILGEIIERYHPEGFADNSWSGLGRSSFCYCKNCRATFRARTGQDIPETRNWDDPLYRQWIQWNYELRLEVWDLNNRVTMDAGGPDCLWIGMNSGSVIGQCQSFRDYRGICRRAEMLLLDHQARSDANGFQDNADTGNLVHGMLGWDKLVPESMAMYQAGKPTYRLSSKPQAEARLWIVEGFAGGLQPWWHHINAYHEDRRMYDTAEPVCRWHKANERFLINRVPIATVGLVWSQQNTDFYGRDDAESLAELPWRGVTQALGRARIPFLPVHADDLENASSQLACLVLPNLGTMSADQAAKVRKFVKQGGGLLATGESSLFNEWGEARQDFALGDLLKAHLAENGKLPSSSTRVNQANATAHSYLRLSPELRAGVNGPQTGSEPPIKGERHPVLRGFEQTDILPFGGALEMLKVDPGAQVLATFVPPFPIFPPEDSWMRQPRTDIPGLILNTTATRGRVAFLPADIDRRYARDHLPDHGNLLANLVRWIAKDSIPLAVEGPGLIDCRLYRQPGRAILHLVNLTNPGAWRQPVDELIPIGPLRVSVKLPSDVRSSRVRLLASDKWVAAKEAGGWARFEVKTVWDHEVAVIGVL